VSSTSRKSFRPAVAWKETEAGVWGRGGLRYCMRGLQGDKKAHSQQRRERQRIPSRAALDRLRHTIDGNEQRIHASAQREGRAARDGC
jgi:hypothetical protein